MERNIRLLFVVIFLLKILYSCIVVIQGPTKNIFGSVVSGTVFKEIADKVYAHEFNQSDLALKIT